MSGKRIINKFLLALFILVVVGSGVWYASQQSTAVEFSSPITTVTSFLKQEPSEVSILVVGDIMLDRNVRNKIDVIGFEQFFKGVEDLLSEPDITIGNLEGPFTTYPSKTASLKSKELTFTFDPALAPKMADLGFDILGLANNHTMNFGLEGFGMTKKYILDAGMSYYGDPNNKAGLSVIFERKGITVGVIGFHEFTYVNFDNVLAEIERVRPLVDFLIVTPHWGVEYQKEPTDKMRGWAHLWIDKGADAVIGAHPHIVGDVEGYNGKKIFYSLGNFAFDQYFSKETSEGLAIKIELTKDENKMEDKYTMIPIRIERDGVFVGD